MEGLWCGDGVGGTLPLYPRAQLQYIAIHLKTTDRQVMLRMMRQGMVPSLALLVL